ncbi:TonB-dependent siderophore receptor [Pseudomonas typographi]|uniref:TonB-dependent receptor n=1 Tax=Pseudomonas typographi TaxID=2715964 RepID=A0ABR7YWD1_9PSED|nr:TonB-dependent receptor [Pseudomonas typographi]MBD1552482.1 TonB-dependent receptor [Pseudomonas typographi]MBD1585572.1 TonB-dependent receptor [Pseudomonas typographi]MBD1597513.1 TonB-dependent receptor [Pseudomonas typographi]
MKHRIEPARRSVKSWLGASVLFAGCATAMAVAAARADEPAGTAQGVQYAFAIGAKALPQALGEFSRVTGLSVIYTVQVPSQVQAPALSGRMSADAAMGQLLAGTGFTFRHTDAMTVVLEPLAQDGALSLPSSQITASLDREGGNSYQPPATSSIARASARVQDIPQSINVVASQVIKDQAPRNLDDALNNVSGITQGNTLGSTQDSVLKRGFGDNRDGSIMQDGMPLVQGRALNATTDRVEVLKGPASLLYGIQDPGGVVNLVAKRPQLTQYNALTARGSSYGNGKNGSGGTLDTTGPLGDSGLAYRLIVDHEDEDYWRNFGTHRESLVAPSLAWYGENTEVVASYQHREFLTPFDRGTVINPNTNHPLDIPATRRLDEPFNDMEGRSDLYQLQVDHHLNDDWKAHLGFSYNRETYDASQIRVTAVNPTAGTLTRSMDGTHNAITHDRFTTLSVEGSQNLFGLQHDLVLGLDDEYRKIYRSDLIRQKSLTTFSYTNPNYGHEVEGSTVSASDSAQLDDLRSNSLFMQDSVHLSDHWIFVAGGRYQLYDQYAGKGRPFNANTDASGQTWVPRAGLVYKLNEQWSFYGSYTESFKPNSSIAALSGNTVLDSGFKPEEGKAWEIGAKLDIPGAITGTVALYDIKKRNVLVSQDVSGTTTYSLAGAVRSRGLEVDLTGQLSQHWSLIGSYAYTDAEVTDDPDYKGNRLQNVARNGASVQAVYDFGSLFGGDRLRVGSGARYVGKRAGDAANSFDLDAYTVADAFASYDTHVGGHNVNVKFNVKNLFDRTYYTSAASRYYVSMGDSRQFVLSSTVEF